MIAKLARKFQRTNELNGHTFDRELSPLAIERGVVINKDRSLGYGFRLDPPYTRTLSDGDQAGIYLALAGFCNALPDHFDIQVIWTQHSRSSEFAARLADLGFSQGLVGEVQLEQQENLLALLREGHLRWIEVYLILVRKLPWDNGALRRMGAARQARRPGPIEWALSFFADARERFQYERAEFASATAEILTHSRALAEILGRLGWSPVALDNDAVVRLFFQRWNPRQFEAGASPRPYRAEPGIPLTERFVHSDFRWDPEGTSVPAGMAELDGWMHAVLTLYEPPEEMARPVFDELLLVCGMMRSELVVNAERGDRPKRMQRLRTVLRQRQSNAETADDPSERAATAQLAQELEEMGANSEGTWRAACYLHLWAAGGRRTARADRHGPVARPRPRHGLHPREAGALALLAGDAAVLDPGQGPLPAARLLDPPARAAAAALRPADQPAARQGDRRPLPDRLAQPLQLDRPDESLFANPHHLIIGGTGSGKSVLQDENLIAMRRRRAKAIIIDLGGSFANFCEASNGVYIDYNIKSRANRINPLWLPPGHGARPGGAALARPLAGVPRDGARPAARGRRPGRAGGRAAPRLLPGPGSRS
jgi:hypothetical protein